MAQTHGSIEDRLVILESAVAALATTSALRHNEMATQVGNSLQQMFLTHQNTLQGIIEKQNALDTKLDRILNTQSSIDSDNDEQIPEESNSNQQNDGSYLQQKRQVYVNWQQKHDELLLRTYVPYYDLFDTLQILNQYRSAPDKLMNILHTPVKVNKSTRFPSDVWYVNVSNLSIKDKIDEIVFAIKMESSAADYQGEIDNILNVLRSLKYGCGIYDMLTFEKAFGLKWDDAIEIEKEQVTINKNNGELDYRTKKDEHKVEKQIKKEERAVEKQIKKHERALESRFRKEERVVEKRIKKEKREIEKRVKKDERVAEKRIKKDKRIAEKRIKKDERALEKQIKKDERALEKRTKKDDVKKELKESSSEESLSLDHPSYTNWDQTYDMSETHSYIGLRALYDTIQFWKTSNPPGFPKQLNTACTKQKISNIFGPLYTVDEETRFPSHGLYLNVDLPSIQSHLETLFRYRNGDDFIREQFQIDIDKFFNVIDNIIFYEEDGIYNRITFEERYQLQWAE